MGRVVRNVDEIRSATGAAFLVIHHSGKDAARGMRGWSGLRAATDTEIEVTADDTSGRRAGEITKQRDLQGKGERIGFKLLPVRLGVNRWGNERSSCVVLAADAPEKKASKPRRPSAIAGAIVEFLTARGSGCARAEMAKHFDGRHARGSVYREVDRMVDEGTLIHTGHIVALAGTPKGAA